MPDVVACLEHHFLWHKKHNLLSGTTILINSFSENISKQQIHRIFEKLDMPHFFASDLDAALKQISELNAL